ncbi:hypothetical protein [Acidisphaera sp. S103]|uniref:hypothetical protein n=1 Tax=Acidisphaera sp. S103 TaxID=1747223 RepID=UPI00131B0194|nr:hypothetical protein [Acidisphaera sp. S103]
MALTRVILRHGGNAVTIDAADERLADGFHGYEPADGLRWTNGFASLPADLFDGFRDGGVEVVLTLRGETQYPDFGESVAA